MKQKREGLCGKYRAWPTWQQSAGIAPALVMWELVSLSECQPIRVEYCGLECAIGRNITMYHRVAMRLSSSLLVDRPCLGE